MNTLDEDRLVNMNFKVPESLKKRIKVYCASHNVIMKDFFIHATEFTMEHYEKLAKQSTPTTTHEVEVQV
jgi:hypothetical protein